MLPPIKPVNKFKAETLKIEMEARKQLLAYIVGAFSFIAGLAWNDAIKGVIENYFPLGEDNLLAKIIYAILITLFVVLVTIILSRLLKAKEIEKK